MENLCFTEKPLQFSEIVHKSLGSLFSLPPLFLSSWRLCLCFFYRRQQHPSASFLPLSLCSAPSRARQLRLGSARCRRRAGERARAAAGAGARAVREWLRRAGEPRTERTRASWRAGASGRRRAGCGRAGARGSGGARMRSAGALACGSRGSGRSGGCERAGAGPATMFEN
jgi:hypothetical protein